MKKIATISILVFLCINLSAQKTAIRNVNIIDVETGKLLPNYAILISGGKISWLGQDNQLTIGTDTKVIDGTGKYMIPGLIDSHIHFFQSGSIYTRPDVVDFTNRVPYEEERRTTFNNATDYLKRYLRLGITTVIDLGGPFSNFAIRDSISKTIISPNILVTGPLFSIVERKVLELNDPPIIKVGSPGDIDALFNKMLPFKPDFIKVWYITGKGYSAEKTFPLVKYIASLSSKNNLKLAVHATQLKTAQLAVEAGASILAHSVEDEVIPDDFVKILKEKKITYIPTLIVMDNYSRVFSFNFSKHLQDSLWANPKAYSSLKDIETIDSSLLPSRIKKIRKYGIPELSFHNDSVRKVNLIKLMHAGINVATGTDAGNIGTFHASSYLQELEAMKEAGLSNEELLKASTINAAIGFGISDKTGSIEKGKNADMLLLQKNPLENITNLNSIELIFKDGKIIKADSISFESHR